MKKIETSKIILYTMIVLSAIITIVGCYAAYKFQSVEILVALTTCVFAELSANTIVYYIKAKEENKAKILISAVKEIHKLEDLTEEQTRIAEALFSNIDSSV